MRRRILRASVGTFVLFLTLMMVPARPATGQLSTMPLSCQDLAFSTEEDFITKGPEPPDGNPVISDGDLLSSFTDAGGNAIPVLCARNVDLLHDTFDVSVDLGLDAADVVSAEGALVAFSTELNSPNAGQFTHGDLLVTNGVMIGNRALTALWQISYDLGLDAVHFTGTSDEIIRFLDEAVQVVQPVDAAELAALLDEVPTVDILFSTEGTYVAKEAVGFLDGRICRPRWPRPAFPPMVWISAWMRRRCPACLTYSNSDSPQRSCIATRSLSQTAMIYAMVPALSSLMAISWRRSSRRPVSWAWMPCISIWR